MTEYLVMTLPFHVRPRPPPPSPVSQNGAAPQAERNEEGWRRRRLPFGSLGLTFPESRVVSRNLTDFPGNDKGPDGTD